MNARERMDAAINLQPVDRVPNAPFYEAPICNYFGNGFRAALLEAQAMADAHLAALEEFKFDWVMVGMGLIGGIIPEALGCEVSYPDDVFPIIENTSVKSLSDIDVIANSNVYTPKMEDFLKGGDRICIFDNLNPNGSLLIGTPDAVAEETRNHLEKAGSMSGYIFSTSGTTSPVTPRENFEAMNQEVLNFGKS